jgi:hypothetical protein
MERFSGWKIYGRTFTLSEDRKFSAYFIVCDDGEKCAAVLNERAVGVFDAAQSVACLDCDDELDAEDLEELGLDMDLVVERDEKEQELCREDESAPVELDYVVPFLSPDGQRLAFSFGLAGNRFVFLDGKCFSVKGRLTCAFFSKDSKRVCLCLEAEDNSSCSYYIDDELVEGGIRAADFTPDGQHFLSLHQPCIPGEETLLSHFLVDGKTVLSDLVLQEWSLAGTNNHPEELGEMLLVDEQSRSALFGIWEKDSDDEELVPVMIIYSFDKGEALRFPGVRILSADNSKSGDDFEVLGAFAADGYQVPRKICYKRGV